MIPYAIHKIIFTIGESFALFTWASFKLAGFLIGVYYLYRESKRRKDIHLNAMMVLGLVIGIGILIGGRAFHFLGPWHITQMSLLESVKAIFAPVGGWVSYGGIIFAIIFGYCYLKIMKLNKEKYADLAAPAVALGFFIGRFGCFFAGMIASKESFLPWAISWNASSVHPVPIYHAIANFVVFMLLLELLRRQDIMNKKRKTKQYGHIFAYGLILYPFFRFFIEFFRIYPEGNYLFGLTMSQNIGIVFFVAGIIYLIKKKEYLLDIKAPLKEEMKTTYILILAGGLITTISILLINISFYVLMITSLAGAIILVSGINKYIRTD